MGGFAENIRRARMFCAKSEAEVASEAGINLPSYYDLEAVEDEITNAISLGQLQLLSVALKTPLRVLFGDNEPPAHDSVSWVDLVQQIHRLIQARRETVEEFENRVGYEMRSALADPRRISEWNVDCLRAVCAELGINWLDTLP